MNILVAKLLGLLGMFGLVLAGCSGGLFRPADDLAKLWAFVVHPPRRDGGLERLGRGAKALRPRSSLMIPLGIVGSGWRGVLSYAGVAAVSVRGAAGRHRTGTFLFVTFLNPVPSWTKATGCSKCCSVSTVSRCFAQRLRLGEVVMKTTFRTLPAIPKVKLMTP
ncbi:hypothetical protein PFLUV_G00105730 [Perca fluviatilis]|uniref:Uncharacterized protein n=1 Tax=Perca fluviatilis TaxID=8168 RepID=A0A6A5F4Q4_PERFL|nr:hypothetical protein PFLUV_G00105730 [Perca fluviatilis]